MILIGLLVGVAAALESNQFLHSIFLGVMAIILLVSFIFKTIAVFKAVNEFNHTVSQNDSLEVSQVMYVSRDPLVELPEGLVKLDDVDDSCKKKEFYAPTDFVDGSKARSELEKCANVCMNHATCSMVVMPNKDGKNNECVYYGTESDASGVLDDVKKSLNQLNTSTDTMKATHYAVIHK